MAPRSARGLLPSAPMSPDAWRALGARFHFQGHGIFYREAGEGPAVVCVHGFPTASWDWHRIWDRLAGRFRVITPDMLGFGFSDKPRDHAYSIHEQASLHEALLSHLGVARVHVLAHDYGDSVAQELLARSEDRRRSGAPGLLVESAVFLNGGLFPEQHRPILVQKLLRSPAGGLIARFARFGTFRRSFPKVFGPGTKPSEAELRDCFALMAWNDGVRITHRLMHYIGDRNAHRDRWVGALVGATVPIRLVNGPEDPVSGRHAAERWRELVPDPDVVLLEGIGHYPQLEDPDGTWAAFAAFHDRLGTSPAG